MPMSIDSSKRATVSDLHGVEGQAELIGGRIVRYPFLGCFPAQIVGSILDSLADYQERTGRGEPFSSTLAYVVPEMPSGRESFSPDASYSFGPFPQDGMKFPKEPPRSPLKSAMKTSTPQTPNASSPPNSPLLRRRHPRRLGRRPPRRNHRLLRLRPPRPPLPLHPGPDRPRRTRRPRLEGPRRYPVWINPITPFLSTSIKPHAFHN